MPILFHEMVHIWQYANGRRGGHGRDFRKELYRVGVDEVRGCVNPGSAAAQAMEIAERTHPELVGRWHAMVGHPPKNQREVERRIFAEYLRAKSARNNPAT